MIWYKKTEDDMSTYRDIIRFKEHTVIELVTDRVTYGKWPVLLLQLGGSDLFTISGSALGYGFTVSIWSKHYGW